MKSRCTCTRLTCALPSTRYIRTTLIFHSDVSRNSEISLQCYLRTEEPKCVGDGVADDMGNDLFLGGIKFVPNFDGLGNNDQWYEFTGGAGKIQLGVSYQPHYGQSITIDDFELMTVIGKGSFGKVGLRCTPILFLSDNARSSKCESETPPVSMLSRPSGKRILSTATKSHTHSLRGWSLPKLIAPSSSPSNLVSNRNKSFTLFWRTLFCS